MRAPLKIAFVAGDVGSGGGVNKVIRDLSELMSAHLQADVTVLARGAISSPTFDFPGETTLEYVPGGVRGWATVLKRLRELNPDFVIGSWTQDNILLILGLFFSRARVVGIEHSSWYFHRWRVRALRRFVYPFAAQILVLNPKELAHYRRFLRNVQLLPNPVRAVRTKCPAKREKLIVAIGHLESHKNFTQAIEAMARSGLEGQGWSFAIIGEGSERDQLQKRISELGLGQTRIHPSTADIAGWYARSSLTLVTATLEVFSLVLAEAMSAGVIPIAYFADGPAYILEEFPEHIVRIGDVAAMAQRMRELAIMKDEDLAALRARMAANINSRFSPDLVMERWQALVAELRRRRKSKHEHRHLPSARK